MAGIAKFVALLERVGADPAGRRREHCAKRDPEFRARAANRRRLEVVTIHRKGALLPRECSDCTHRRGRDNGRAPAPRVSEVAHRPRTLACVTTSTDRRVR